MLAVAGISERFGTPVSMAIWFVMWLLYLSFVNVGQTWYCFGWETLLLEAGFLAIFLGARNVAPPVIVIWMFRWVLFRLMFGAGLIKLRGDPCWRDLTCLIYHYQSQPIPNPLSWYFNRLPAWIDKAGVLFNHLAELVAPFGYLVPFRPVRYTAGRHHHRLPGHADPERQSLLAQLDHHRNRHCSCFDDRLLSRILPVHAGPLHPIALPHQIAVTRAGAAGRRAEHSRRR